MSTIWHIEIVLKRRNTIKRKFVFFIVDQFVFLNDILFSNNQSNDQLKIALIKLYTWWLPAESFVYWLLFHHFGLQIHSVSKTSFGSGISIRSLLRVAIILFFSITPLSVKLHDGIIWLLIAKGAGP